ncbi:MAG TPA: PIN domain-containing protein [Terriglobales bacterium]|nr:PIN domain-containing protein [Terriglobales bacterium]
MGNFVVFDTSIFIDHLRTGRHQQRIATTTGLVRNSAVVLAELSRGATKHSEQEFVERLARNHPILTPSENNWLESGRLLSKIRSDKGLVAEKLCDLHFDLLIALTARSVGARLVTSDRADFELIVRYRKLQLEIW